MIKKTDEELQFWEYDEKGKPKILQSKLISFLESEGFVNIKVNSTNYVLVRKLNNKVSESSIEELTQIIREHLNKLELDDIYEKFATGIGNYLTGRKIGLLNNVELIDDRDGKDYSRIYFQNCFVRITKTKITESNYNVLDGEIWENRLLKKKFEFPKTKERGQFESFCWNISKKNDDRFKALKSIIGYLMHRNRDRGEDKAIILYDENMGKNSKAHGGTGKSLLCEAINQIRENIVFDGKDVKIGSWFKNQRVDLTTDVMVYDDLNKLISLENFFSMITNGVEVEQKRKQSFHIPRERAPKIVITSNYLVAGPGGSSDMRRRHEFELANYYNEDYRPEDEFGCRFFDFHWEIEQWNKFYYFMMQCLQTYLTEGLIKAEQLNLQRLRIENTSCKEFVEYTKLIFEFNKWIDKREFDEMFKTEYPKYKNISSKMMTKWLTAFAGERGGYISFKSSGGDYFVMIEKIEDEEEV